MQITKEESNPNSGRTLSKSQLERYSRQILLSEIGVRGQMKLRESKVAIVGVGGLGSPAALYLAAAGVGVIGLIDADRVDLSNLHRQILHDDHYQGKSKTQSGRHRLENVNPEVQVVEHPEWLTSKNATEILSGYDVVVNGCDNFPTRYLVNDACVLLDKPLVDACILRWEGHVQVFRKGKGCYRCLFPHPPEPGTVPSCAEAGIVGAVAGTMGSMQALETIKILLQLDSVLDEHTLTYHVLSGEFYKFRRMKRKDCPVCGEEPTVHALMDYEEFCGFTPSTASEPISSSFEIALEDAVSYYGDEQTIWVDVRKQKEYMSGHIPKTLHLPLDELQERSSELPEKKRIMLVCKSGKRSLKAAEILNDCGFSRVFSLSGGMLDWENRGYPMKNGTEE
ncbi:ThiF family adenylyltransferase [Desmospora profundinema]|uniref:Adenylyltransferase/sulfurtransferase n=1 Tax=Desmospora profundinema TaxID=1571184 RepID=A0ABU1IMI2_9BACL|nr:ThiF family adenylyltransferase [Desmospora profundinema]MDR6225991.1 adenylyltransferase/sulfurtransferase [Desmospora profundinema]